MGKIHSKPLAARHGRGTARARHTMCESALKGQNMIGFIKKQRLTSLGHVERMTGKYCAED
jgi:hypothetical protein